MLKQQANKTKQMNGFTNYIVKPKLNSIKLQELKFGPGDGQLHYYLYNYRIRSALKPSGLGLVLFEEIGRAHV